MKKQRRTNGWRTAGLSHGRQGQVEKGVSDFESAIYEDVDKRKGASEGQGRLVQTGAKLLKNYYPINWPTLAADCLKRHNHTCVDCGAQHEDAHPLAPITVYLAASHQDHDTTNNAPENLQARCQVCHLLHDVWYHAENARNTREGRIGVTNVEFGRVMEALRYSNRVLGKNRVALKLIVFDMTVDAAALRLRSIHKYACDYGVCPKVLKNALRPYLDAEYVELRKGVWGLIARGSAYVKQLAQPVLPGVTPAQSPDTRALYTHTLVTEDKRTFVPEDLTSLNWDHVTKVVGKKAKGCVPSRRDMLAYAEGHFAAQCQQGSRSHPDGIRSACWEATLGSWIAQDVNDGSFPRKIGPVDSREVRALAAWLSSSEARALGLGDVDTEVVPDQERLAALVDRVRHEVTPETLAALESVDCGGDVDAQVAAIERAQGDGDGLVNDEYAAAVMALGGRFGDCEKGDLARYAALPAERDGDRWRVTFADSLDYEWFESNYMDELAAVGVHVDAIAPVSLRLPERRRRRSLLAVARELVDVPEMHGHALKMMGRRRAA